MLKPILDTLEGLPDVIKAEYKQDAVTLKYVLDTPVDEHPAVTGLKNALTATRAERDEAKDKLKNFEGLDPEKYRTMLTTEQRVVEGQLIAAGKVEELVELRTKALRESMAGETNREREQRISLEAQLNRLVIDNSVQSAAAKHGVADGALDDVLNRARSTFKTKDGVAVAYDGENVVYGKTGTAPLTIDEWMEGLAVKAKHLFKPSEGVKAPGGTTRPVAGPGTVVRGDQSAFLANLDAIAKGKMKVI
jgi:uncharacterized protein YkwD